MELNGMSWPERCYDGHEEEHFFLIGDYGGLTCNHKVNGYDPNAWTCGRSAEPGPFAKSADNTKDHPERGRVFVPGSDDRPQARVAEQMRKIAPARRPKYFLNGGDNFYFGGLDTRCGYPMDQIHERTRAQFDVIFEQMYSGEGMDVPWLSTLGNHDFGGRKFNAAWDQQIAYTWGTNTSKRWILPALYWHQHVRYPAKKFTVDIYMVDTNKGDAKPWTEDAGHNICGTMNPVDASCSSAGGPRDKYSCSQWFDALWNTQSDWLDKKLNESVADWQIIVTHFPPDQFNGKYWKALTIKHGIDLFVGSHRHMQEVHMKDARYGGLNYVVVGGGGGITSEWNPGSDERGHKQYGFMDVKINKTHIDLVSFNHYGYIVDRGSIDPRPPQGAPTCAHYGCNTEFKDWMACHCNADCWKYGSCCGDWGEVCPALASCAVFGCFENYDRRKPCHCSPDCVGHNNCCHDYKDKCDTPEYRAAVAACDTDCLDTGNTTFPCRERTNFETRKKHKKLATALEAVNAECAGQCKCTETAMLFESPSLVQEAAEADDDEAESISKKAALLAEAESTSKKAALLDKRMQLLDELSSVEAKLAPGKGKNTDEPLDNGRIWSDTME